MARVSGKIALVTGGAMGIGRACAITLAREGATVIVTDFNDEAGEATVAEITSSGAVANYIHHDVTQESAWIAVMEQIMDRYGRLDILVNNAGIAVMVPFLEMSLEDYQRQNAVNLDGVFLGLKHGILNMIKTERSTDETASVINLSSVAGLKAAPGLAAYSMTKGGVRLLSKSVAKECADGGLKVRVNSVHPGIIETSIWEAMVTDSPAGENRPVIAEIAAAAVPGGVIGRADDIANGVLYLASDESRYVTGSELVIDHAISA